jgi:hypothetical protein
VRPTWVPKIQEKIDAIKIELQNGPILRPIPEIDSKIYESIMTTFENRKNNLFKECPKINEKRIFSRHQLGLQVPEKKFLVCAPWKCSSSYWRGFTESLLVARTYLKNIKIIL